MANNAFWLGQLPFDQYKQGRESFSVPAFSFSGLTWLGASYIFARMSFSGSRDFALKLQSEAPSDEFVAVVNDGGTRYKLWSDVGEVLDLPLYENQALSSSSILELWTVQGTTAPSSTGLTLYTSRLLDRPSVASTDTTTTLTVDDELWEDMPLVLPATFNQARN